jgi:hypothetical protein
MITLDEIIPYQPSAQISPKPTLHYFPSLTHPLPKRPVSPITSPKHADDLGQVQYDLPVKHHGISPHANAFDSKLATLDMVELDNATLTDVNQNDCEEQLGTNTSGLSR